MFRERDEAEKYMEVIKPFKETPYSTVTPEGLVEGLNSSTLQS